MGVRSVYIWFTYVAKLPLRPSKFPGMDFHMFLWFLNIWPVTLKQVTLYTLGLFHTKRAGCPLVVKISQQLFRYSSLHERPNSSVGRRASSRFNRLDVRHRFKPRPRTDIAYQFSYLDCVSSSSCAVFTFTIQTIGRTSPMKAGIMR